ncbi:MAG: SDR family NAD(P)-dependent oxidoreductase [Chloroflexota bacterium]|nr:SDR family NAD(P)-dependent oxidoreductase [Chloroflexota bacterium]
MRLQQKIRDDALTVGVGLAVGGVVRRTMTTLRETNLRGEVALITGARSRQSLAIARELAAAGCRVVLAVTDRAANRMTDHALRAHGIELFVIPADVAEGETMLPWVEGATTRYGRIDLLVAIAGAQLPSAAPSASLASELTAKYQTVMQPVLAVLPRMQQRRHGRIVTVTEASRRQLSPAAEATLAFSRNLRAQVRDDGVVVTTILIAERRQLRHEAETDVSFAQQAYLDGIARQVVQAIRREDADLTLPRLARITSRLKRFGALPCASQRTRWRRRHPVDATSTL